VKKKVVAQRDAVRCLRAAKRRLEQAQQAIADAVSEVDQANADAEEPWSPIPAPVANLNLSTPIAALDSVLAEEENRRRA
jgi:HAMP domain-containing protein